MQQVTYRTLRSLVSHIALTCLSTVAIVACPATMGFCQQWQPVVKNGYTWFQDGANVACPLTFQPGSPTYWYTAIVDREGGTTYSVPDTSGSVSLVYVRGQDIWTAPEGRLPLTHLDHCDVAHYQQVLNTAYNNFVSTVGKYYESYYYFRYVEADKIMQACKATALRAGSTPGGATIPTPTELYGGLATARIDTLRLLDRYICENPQPQPYGTVPDCPSGLGYQIPPYEISLQTHSGRYVYSVSIRRMNGQHAGPPDINFIRKFAPAAIIFDAPQHSSSEQIGDINYQRWEWTITGTDGRLVSVALLMGVYTANNPSLGYAVGDVQAVVWNAH